MKEIAVSKQGRQAMPLSTAMTDAVRCSNVRDVKHGNGSNSMHNRGNDLKKNTPFVLTQ